MSETKYVRSWTKSLLKRFFWIFSGSTPDPIHDMMQTGQEFPTRSHPIHYFFGLNEFVTFSPNAPKEKEDIDNETRAKVNFHLTTLFHPI